MQARCGPEATPCEIKTRPCPSPDRQTAASSQFKQTNTGKKERQSMLKGVSISANGRVLHVCEQVRGKTPSPGQDPIPLPSPAPQSASRFDLAACCPSRATGGWLGFFFPRYFFLAPKLPCGVHGVMGHLETHQSYNFTPGVTDAHFFQKKRGDALRRMLKVSGPSNHL